MTLRAVMMLVTLLATFMTGCSSLPIIMPNRDPLTPQEHQTLGNGYMSKGEKDLATKQYQSAIRQDKRYTPALMALGNMAFELHDWKHAESYFERALKITPLDAGASNNLAMVYLAKGKSLPKAKRLIEQALPGAGALSPYLYDTSASIALQEGRLEDAKSALDLAKAQAPAHDPEFEKHWQETMDRYIRASQAVTPAP